MQTRYPVNKPWNAAENTDRNIYICIVVHGASNRGTNTVHIDLLPIQPCQREDGRPKRQVLSQGSSQ